MCVFVLGSKASHRRLRRVAVQLDGGRPELHWSHGGFFSQEKQHANCPFGAFCIPAIGLKIHRGVPKPRGDPLS